MRGKLLGHKRFRERKDEEIRERKRDVDEKKFEKSERERKRGERKKEKKIITFRR